MGLTLSVPGSRRALGMLQDGHKKLHRQGTRDGGQARSDDCALLVHGAVRCGVEGGDDVVAEVAPEVATSFALLRGSGCGRGVRGVSDPVPHDDESVKSEGRVD